MHLGSTGNGMENAKTQTAPASSAAIVATPVNEKELTTAKPAGAATNSANESGKAKDSASDKNQPNATKPAEPAKKKGHLHILKKIVDPF